MLESNYFKRAIQRFGVSVNITDGSGSKTVKAFMNPLRARHRLYLSTKLGGVQRQLGWRSGVSFPGMLTQ